MLHLPERSRVRLFRSIEMALSPAALQELQGAIAQLDNPAYQQLDYEIRKLLGWTTDTPLGKSLANTGLDNAGVDALHGAYFGSNPPQPLQLKTMQHHLTL